MTNPTPTDVWLHHRFTESFHERDAEYYRVGIVEWIDGRQVHRLSDDFDVEVLVTRHHFEVRLLDRRSLRILATAGCTDRSQLFALAGELIDEVTHRPEPLRLVEVSLDDVPGIGEIFADFRSADAS